MEKKLGEFWRIELVESNITIRGTRTLRLMEVRQKKRKKLSLLEVWYVCGLLRQTYYGSFEKGYTFK
jgi:hypothetical protein